MSTFAYDRLAQDLVRQAGQVLVGALVFSNFFAGFQIPTDCQLVVDSDHREVHRVAPKLGYVVTAMVAKHGHRLDGMRLLFMRVRGDRLNPDDAYRSDWIGGRGGGGERLYGDYGNPVVSIFGRKGHDLDALGFAYVAL